MVIAGSLLAEVPLSCSGGEFPQVLLLLLLLLCCAVGFVRCCFPSSGDGKVAEDRTYLMDYHCDNLWLVVSGQHCRMKQSLLYSKCGSAYRSKEIYVILNEIVGLIRSIFSMWAGSGSPGYHQAMVFYVNVHLRTTWRCPRSGA